MNAGITWLLQKQKKNKDLYTYPYILVYIGQYMSGKLYWRYKKDGNWTWRPVVVNGEFKEFHKILDSLGLTLWDIETMREEE
jgi:hypothetical protein